VKVISGNFPGDQGRQTYETINFAKIFPELAESIKRELDEENRALGNDDPLIRKDEVNATNQRESSGSSFTATFFMICGFAVLAFTVRYVIQNAAM